MSDFWYHFQFRGEANRSTAERELTLPIQAAGGDSWGEPDELCAESGELKKAGALERKVEAEKNGPEFCTSFAESALQVTSTGQK